MNKQEKQSGGWQLLKIDVADPPLVTVIIPTYKRAVEYLSRAVQSVIDQTYPNIEIIVIDDSPEDYAVRNDIKAYMDSVSSDKVKYYQKRN